MQCICSNVFAFFPRQRIEPGIKLDELPGDVMPEVVPYLSVSEVGKVSGASRLFSGLRNKKILELKNRINKNAETIKDIKVDDVTNMTEYLALAKQAVNSNPLEDPYAQRPYAIKHIKLDKDGVVGLNPGDFMTVVQMAMEGNIQCTTDIRKLVNGSNYDESEKNRILTHCSRLFDQQESSGYCNNEFPVIRSLIVFATGLVAAASLAQCK
jgi:hypothetical protein